MRAIGIGREGLDPFPTAKMDRSYPSVENGGQVVVYERDEARTRGIELLRVDCYSGPDEKLVRFYESVGFTRTERINVRDDIHVQVFADRLSTRP